MDYVRPFTLEDIERSEARAAEEGHPFIIEIDGRGIGRIGLNNFRPRDGLASLYIFVGEKTEWHKGLGLDALMAVLRFGFDLLELRKIELWMLDGNERAAHAYKAAGLVEDARLPERSLKDGVYVNHIVMSIDREGFERSRVAYGI